MSMFLGTFTTKLREVAGITVKTIKAIPFSFLILML
jgi:hypothetical protein